jgi:leucyl aminopeptidase
VPGAHRDDEPTVTTTTTPTITTGAGAPLDYGAPVLVVLTTPDDPVGRPFPAGQGTAEAVGVDAGRVLAAERARGDAGEVVAVPLGRDGGPDRLLFLGTGNGEAVALRSAGAALARRAAAAGRATVDARGLAAAALGAFAEGVGLAAYAPAGPKASKVLTEAVLVVDDPAGPGVAEALARAGALARAVHVARDLVNTPSLVKSPAWLADQAALAAAAAGLDIEVLGPDALAAGGFGGIIGVGAGSSRPPRLVRLTYTPPPAPGAARARHVVLVGKGVTFDSGGLSLKPAVPMAGMKTDMAGAAAVLATMTALGTLRCPVKVTGVLCIAENMIGGGAARPGDVLTTWDGTTVEVLNTDAEGRLVLADGLSYAAATLAPDAMVDLATLTGAISIALGRRTAGLFSSDDALAEALAEASRVAGERVWRLPLTEEYRPALDSAVADLANVGKALDVSGGSITAALFLREFTAGVPWAHLDIAGAARSDSDDGEISKGGTGWGVRTLLAWLA